MGDESGGTLYVLISASAARRRLKGHGFGVRRVESAGKNRAAIFHTATGRHFRQLEAFFSGIIDQQCRERETD